jgi:hypothetical protein
MESIDELFFLGFGNSTIEIINSFNPLFPKFITDFLLDFYFFKSVSNSMKKYILASLITFLGKKTVIQYDGNFEIITKIASATLEILLLIGEDDCGLENCASSLFK